MSVFLFTPKPHIGLNASLVFTGARVWYSFIWPRRIKTVIAALCQYMKKPITFFALAHTGSHPALRHQEGGERFLCVMMRWKWSCVCLMH